MTVQELIAHLQEEDPEANVIIEHYCSGTSKYAGISSLSTTPNEPFNPRVIIASLT